MRARSTRNRRRRRHENVVGGVTPGKGGTTHESWPIFNNVHDAVKETGANATVIFVPPPLRLMPSWKLLTLRFRWRSASRRDSVVDMLKALTFMEGKPTRLVGPNCPDISAGKAKAGIIPGHICREGRIGIVSKSGTLTYEAIHQLTRRCMVQTTCIGIGETR